MQPADNPDQELIQEQKFSALNPMSLNEIRSSRRPAVSTLKIRVSVVPKNNLHNLAYQRRNALINPPRGLISSVNLTSHIYDN